MQYTILDLFAGCGGFSCGFEQAGFRTVGAVEFDKDAALTYKNNHNNCHMFLGDIRKLDIEEIKRMVGFPDVIIGGPPCQGFSIAGKRNPNDERNQLPLEFIKYIRYFKPKVFVMENVKGLLSMEEGKTIEYFIEQFEASGYKVKHKLLLAVKHGVPQLRERVIIVGIRNDIDIEFEYPQEEDIVTTLGQAIGDIEEVGTFEETNQYNHEVFSPVDERIYNLLEEGKFLCDLRHGSEHVHSWEISLKGHCSEREALILNSISENRRKKQYGPKDGNPLSRQIIEELSGLQDIEEDLNRLLEMEYIDQIGDKYDIHDRKINVGLRRFSRNQPANTITTQSGVNSAYAHYSRPRNFTVREVARIQTFPDNFIFYGPVSKQYRQVGNAVPPLLSRKIAEQILTLLNNASV